MFNAMLFRLQDVIREGVELAFQPSRDASTNVRDGLTAGRQDRDAGFPRNRR